MTLSASNNEVAICNLALTQLKQTLITQIDPPKSNAEKLCALHYQDIRQATLRAHPWNFAIKRIVLTEDTGNPPVFGYSKAFALPSDFIRYLSRHSDFSVELPTDIRGTDYELENGYLLTSDTFSGTGDLNLRYTYDHTEVAKWDASFKQLIAINLAIVLAPNFTSSEARLQSLAALRDDIESKAMSIDGQERPPTRVQNSRWIRARISQPRVASPYTIFDR
jgi:hypothetical protein